MGLAVRDAETVLAPAGAGRSYPLLLESGKKPAGGAVEEGNRETADSIALAIRELADDSYQVRELRQQGSAGDGTEDPPTYREGAGRCR